jgi:hypothetical protein
MRKIGFVVFLASLAMLFVGTGCTDKKTTSDVSVSVDTMLTDTLGTDSMEALIEDEPMPKAADELFDDFIFNFAANRRLQSERTDYPVNVDTYGKLSKVEKSKWGMEHFFMRQGYYTLVFNSASQLDVVKDTAISSVYVEKISFAKRKVTRWQFNRVLGLWKMQGVRIMALTKHEDASFLRFYNNFVTNPDIQSVSIAESVSFSGPDPEDDFSRMTGELMAEQVPAFLPWMPSGTLYNIHYGDQPYKPSNTRIFVVRGIANGMESELTFQKKSGGWMLTKLNT